jgi:transposase InsO family protein
MGRILYYASREKATGSGVFLLKIVRARYVTDRGTIGSDSLVRRTAERLGLEASLRPRGRPQVVKIK